MVVSPLINYYGKSCLSAPRKDRKKGHNGGNEQKTTRGRPIFSVAFADLWPASVSGHHALQYGNERGTAVGAIWDTLWVEEITVISLAQMNSRHGARPLVRLIKTRKTFWLEPFRFSNFSASLCNIHIYIYTYIYSFRCTIVCTYVRTIVRRVVQEYFTVEIVQALLSFFFFSSFFLLLLLLLLPLGN